MAGFDRLASLIERKLGGPTARRLLSTIRKELAGTRLVIPAKVDRQVITDRQLYNALAESAYNIEAAARRLGVSKATVYRRLTQRRQQRQRPQREPGPRMAGRTVR